MKMTRAFYSSSTYTHFLTVEALGVEAHHSACGRYVIGFSGKRQKPDFHYSFKDQTRAAEYVAKWLDGIERRAAEKAEHRANRQATPNLLKVGDVLKSEWGYDQTNVDYYEVVSLVGAHFVIIREIGRQADYCSGAMTGACVPHPGNFIGEPQRRRVSAGSYVKINSFASASLLKPTAEVDGVRMYPPSRYSTYA